MSAELNTAENPPVSKWRRNLATHLPPGQFARYLVTGAGNTLFGYGSFAALTALLTPVIPKAYILAVLISSLINITFSYLTYKWFVFKTKGNYLREWSRVVVVYSGSIALGVILLPLLVWILERTTNLHRGAPYIAGACLTAISVVFSFVGHRRFSFADASKLAPESDKPAP